MPLTPNNPGQTLDFQVAINTRSIDLSIDLSMDLATLATLNTNKGRIVQAMVWDAPRGGHHVREVLSFPTVDSLPLLNGASKMTLILLNPDAPERVVTREG